MHKAPVKVPSKTQTASKDRGNRRLEKPPQSAMPAPTRGKVNRARRSVWPGSTIASNPRVGPNVSTMMPTQDVAEMEELSSSSESDTQPVKKEIVDRIE